MSPNNPLKKWDICQAGINPLPSALANAMGGSSDLVRQDEPGKGSQGDVPLGPWLKADRCALILSRPGPARAAEPKWGSREPQAGGPVSRQIVTGLRRPELPNRKGKNRLKEAPAPDTQAQSGVRQPPLLPSGLGFKSTRPSATPSQVSLPPTWTGLPSLPALGSIRPTPLK